MDEKDPKEPMMDDCLSCHHCTVLKAGRKKTHPHPCTSSIILHASEEPVPGRLFRLYNLLRHVFPPEIWKTFKRPKGYRPETHFKPKRLDVPKERISQTPCLLRSLRAKTRSLVTLRSESPLKVLQAYHGADVLLRPVRPGNELKSPLTDFERQELERLKTQRRAKILASQQGLSVGGIENRLSLLESLRPIEPSDELKELEPLRAMSLQEVTNVPLLIQARGTTSEEEE